MVKWHSFEPYVTLLDPRLLEHLATSHPRSFGVGRRLRVSPTGSLPADFWWGCGEAEQSETEIGVAIG